MADKTDKQRRLAFAHNTRETEKNKNLPNMRGWEVMSSDGESIGRVDELIADVKEDRLRYIDIELNEDLRKQRGNGEKENLSVPVGLARADSAQQQVTVQKDRNLINQGPLHRKGSLLTYEQEMKIRALFEDADKAYTKSGVQKPQRPKDVVETRGEEINEQIVDPDEGRKRDVDINEGRLADSMQGQYTQNLQGDQEGIKKPGPNPEGKHDVQRSTGDPDRPQGGSGSDELYAAAAPEKTEEPSTDKPGDTLGRAEVDNRYRDAENKDLPEPHGPPENPLNANDDFYRHDMFDEDQLLKK